MSVAHDHGYGPYTVYELDAMPEEGKGYELADGWLIPLSPTPRHDMAAEIVREILRNAARAAKAAVYVQAPMDVSTPSGVRRPDVAVIDKDAARAAHEENSRTYYGHDVCLVVEVVTRRSGSEQVDRVDKLIDYARAGIDHYWIVDLEPHPRVQVHTLLGPRYERTLLAPAGTELTVDAPFPIAFDPARLLEPDELW